MSSVLFRARPQAIALALIAVGAAGCSSETTRFNDNPYAARQGEVTGTVSAAPAGRIEQTQLAPPAASRPTSAAPAAGVVGGGRGMATYQPGTAPSPDVTGSVQ